MNDLPITFCLPDGATLGGVTTWTFALADRLSAQGRTVRVMEHQSSNDTLKVSEAHRVVSDGFDVVSLADLGRPNDVTVSTGDVLAYADRYQLDCPQLLIPSWSWGSYAAACEVARRDAGASKIVAFVHADGPDYYDWMNYYESAISQFVAVSDDIGTELERRLGHRKADISVLPYPVAVDPDLRRPPSQADQPLQVIYAGRISLVQKRVLDLINVIEGLAAESNVRLRVIGGGPDESAFDDALARASQRTRSSIERIGTVPAGEMRDLWRSADVCLLTSDYEGTSITMLEAMAAGVVPVVTQVSGTDAVITDGENGFTSPVGDVAGLAHHLDLLSRDRQRLDAMSLTAHQQALDRMTVPSYDRSFDELMERAASGPARVLEAPQALLPGSLHATLGDVRNALGGDHHAAKRVAFWLGANRLSRPLLAARPLVERIVNRIRRRGDYR